MALREFLADFEDGTVQDASFTRRPDAVVPLVPRAPGPRALADATDGVQVKGWYARYDVATDKLYLAGALSPRYLTWEPEVELLEVGEGPAIVALSLAFDIGGRPVLAMERDGNVWVRYWDGAAYTFTDLGPGTNPTLVHQSPANALWRELWLIYQVGTSVMYRKGSEDYASEYDSLWVLNANEEIEAALLDATNRVHVRTSVHDAVEGEYSVDRITASSTPPCMEVTGYSDRVDDGLETTFIFTGDGEIVTTCELECDILLIAAGGDSGAGGQGDPTILWASLDGVALDPETDTPPAVHKAIGGGHGALLDQDGGEGGGGGGGGGQSPSTNTMWSAGGQGNAQSLDGIKRNGGGGQSTWGLLPKKKAASGGGGGYGGHGTCGLCLQGAPSTPGQAGYSAPIPGWPWSGPAGGHGKSSTVDTPSPSTGPVEGGGGHGGVISLIGFIIQPGQRIPLEVAFGEAGAAGMGGWSGRGGRHGMIAVRVKTEPPQDYAVVSGGDVVVDPGDGYRYYVFTATGTLTVVTPGKADVLAVAGAAGGGSGCGGGGGGGDVRLDEANLSNPTYAVTVGTGGAGGVAGAVGEDGADSLLGTLVETLGGGGGAGEGTAAGSRATGGGGHGFDGTPGPGAPYRGYPGGEGGGYDLSAGGDAASAGGGGGAGDAGDVGAEMETQGDELTEAWEVPSTGLLQVAEQQFRLLESGGTHHGIIKKDVAVAKMFIQALVNTGHSNLDAGPIARAQHPTADPDEVPTGYHAALNHNGQTFAGGAYEFDLGSWHHLQVYVEDSLQQYAAYGYSGSPRAWQVGGLRQTTDATLNGTLRSFGFAAKGTPITGTNKQAYAAHLLPFRDKYLLVAGVPTGGSVQVLNAAGDVVGTATETAGVALVDLSMYGLVCTEPCPFEGFQTIEVLDAGSAIVGSRSSGAVFPGGEYDLVAGELVVRIDETGDEPVPIFGPLPGFTTFNELTPGPNHGDGGLGRELPAEWAAALAGVVGDDGYFGGGGGGGAELLIAGVAREGGGGAGGVGAGTPPTAGSANTGGGGGGSGDPSVPGAAGGSGVIVVRTLRPPPAIPTAGLIFDGNAQDLTGLDPDEVMTGWPDSSAAENDMVASGSPIYKVSGINGYPSVRTGVSNYFAFLTAILNGEAAGEIMAVLQADADPPGATNVAGIWHFSASNFSAHHPYTDSKTYEAWGRGTRLDLGNLAQALNAGHVYDVVSAADEYTVRVNDTQVYTSASNTVTFLATPPLIGKSKDAFYFGGLWGRILVWNRRLETWERNDVLAILNDEWGIA